MRHHRRVFSVKLSNFPVIYGRVFSQMKFLARFVRNNRVIASALMSVRLSSGKQVENGPGRKWNGWRMKRMKNGSGENWNG